jgi:hypothetical protein
VPRYSLRHMPPFPPKSLRDCYIGHRPIARRY